MPAASRREPVLAAHGGHSPPYKCFLSARVRSLAPC
jgi:hypothetical protein